MLIPEGFIRSKLVMAADMRVSGLFIKQAEWIRLVLEAAEHEEGGAETLRKLEAAESLQAAITTLPTVRTCI